MRRPGYIAVGVDQHPQLRLPGPRSGLVGHRSWNSTNISQLQLQKVPERCRVSIVRSTGIRTFVSTVTRHSAATPQKRDAWLRCPRTRHA